MNARDWLLDKTKHRRRLATGGPAAAAGPILEPGPAPFAIPRTAQRVWVGDRELPDVVRIEFTLHPPTPDDLARMRARLNAMRITTPTRLAVTRGEATYLCGCAPQYARCQCPDSDGSSR